mmetsp:Transcript_35017/g.83923  ORF Transcript_35017/g.83923 Transcript_35017/m.83923 type:complete len:265 (+) Transcript_35017:339-1133(+)
MNEMDRWHNASLGSQASQPPSAAWKWSAQTAQSGPRWPGAHQGFSVWGSCPPGQADPLKHLESWPRLLRFSGIVPCGISMISGWQVQPLGQAQGAQAPCCNWARPAGQRRQPRFRDGKTVSPSSSTRPEPRRHRGRTSPLFSLEFSSCCWKVHSSIKLQLAESRNKSLALTLKGASEGPRANSEMFIRRPSRATPRACCISKRCKVAGVSLAISSTLPRGAATEDAFRTPPMSSFRFAKRHPPDSAVQLRQISWPDFDWCSTLV